MASFIFSSRYIRLNCVFKYSFCIVTFEMLYDELILNFFLYSRWVPSRDFTSRLIRYYTQLFFYTIFYFSFSQWKYGLLWKFQCSINDDSYLKTLPKDSVSVWWIFCPQAPWLKTCYSFITILIKYFLIFLVLRLPTFFSVNILWYRIK